MKVKKAVSGGGPRGTVGWDFVESYKGTCILFPYT